MKNGGVAILGSAAVTGENRALNAVEQALNSPLLNDNDIRGAKWILLNITSAAGEFEHTMDEAEEIQAYVQDMAGDNCDVILGMGHDPNLGDKIAVTVIATGFHHKELDLQPVKSNEPEKIVVALGDTKASNAVLQVPVAETPTAYPAPEVPQNTMMPTLVEMPTAKTNGVVIDAKPHFAPVQEDKETFTLNMTPQQAPVVATATEPTPAPVTAPVAKVEEAPVAEVKSPTIELVIKNEEPQVKKEETPTVIGERVLTAEEIEERNRFEEQKRALEERAERLRRMSFNIKSTESSDEVENVPAYLRKNVQMENGVNSEDTFYSGYTVSVNENQNNNQVSIQTINTFLDGKKPD
jgi:cell division protein FtsZ